MKYLKLINWKVLTGDVSDLRGDVTGLRGDVSGLRGDVTGLRGDVTTFLRADYDPQDALGLIAQQLAYEHGEIGG